MYRNKITKYGLFITKDIFYNQLIFRVKKQLEGLENLRFNIDNHKDLLYDIFLNRYRDRISRFDNWAAHFDKMTEIFVDNYPSLSRQIWVAQDKEWADILTRKGYRIKSFAKSDNKSESDNTASVSSTPGDYSTNEMDEMIQSFNKNKSIVDTKGNTISDTEQYDLFNQLSKMVNIHIPRIFNNWIINFDKLFSNFDYQGDWAPCDIKNRYVFNFIYEFISENRELFRGPQGPEGPKGPLPSKNDVIEWTKNIKKGDIGPRGPEGPRGPQGPQGPEGPRGPKGDVGEASPEEIQKWTKHVKKGDQGPQGPQGPEGPEGPRGPQGPEGPQGPQGPEGPEGPQGPEGPEGPEGPQGPKGDNLFKKSPGGGEYSKIDNLPLGMNQSRISELKKPESDDDAATKKYVDDLFNNNNKNNNDKFITFTSVQQLARHLDTTFNNKSFYKFGDCSVEIIIHLEHPRKSGFMTHIAFYSNRHISYYYLDSPRGTHQFNFDGAIDLDILTGSYNKIVYSFLASVGSQFTDNNSNENIILNSISNDDLKKIYLLIKK